MADKIPAPGAGQGASAGVPKVFGTLDPSFVVQRRGDATERILRVGEGFGATRTPAPPRSPASDPRGDRNYTRVKRDPPAQDSAASPVRVVGGSPKSKAR